MKQHPHHWSSPFFGFAVKAKQQSRCRSDRFSGSADFTIEDGEWIYDELWIYSGFIVNL
jgi:hypothetical protein